MTQSGIQVSREYLEAVLRQCEECFEQDGTPTDPYSLVASHLLLLPYENVGTVSRESIKRSMHAAGY